MKEGNYLITIRILEASDLIPISASGVVNPYCVVSLRGDHKSTFVERKTLSPLWDQNFVFEINNLKKGDLETAIIKIEVVSQEYYIFNEIIGTYEIDLSSIYFEKYHQFYMTWFTLADPLDVREGVQGYVKANIDVIGPGDRPHVNEKITEDSVAQTVVSNKIQQVGHLIIAELFRAEHLSPLNMLNNYSNAYVKINYGGVTIQSSVSSDQNPSWNQILYLQAMLPNHSKNVQIELFNYNTVMEDELLGTCLIPFNSFKCIEDLPPMWINIYGPPLCASGPIANQMAIHGFKMGSSYRGRVLMRFSSCFIDNPRSNCVDMAFRMPEMLVPTPPTKAYFLRIDVYSGQELPGNKGMLHFSIGPYLKKTHMTINNQGIFDWNFECIEFNRVLLPIDVFQIPDLIVYFADDDYESHRKCFYRIEPAKILNKTRKRYSKDFQRPYIVKFKEDQSLDLVSDDQFSGFVILRPVLFAYEPPSNQGIEKLKNDKFEKKEYLLRMFFYIGRDIPTANEAGTCNPLIVIRVANEVIYSKIKKNTLNPEWYEVEQKVISTYNIKNPDSPALAIVVMLYHVEDADANPSDLFKDKVEDVPNPSEKEGNTALKVLSEINKPPPEETKGSKG